MPKVVDHDKRRRELSDAVLRVIARSGVGAVTNRVVAAEAGWSTGVLTHYMGNQHDLLLAALRRAAEAQGEAFRALASTPQSSALERLRQLLRSVLPLDGQSLALTRVFLFFYAEAAVSEVMREEIAAYLAGWRRVVRRCVVAAQDSGELSRSVDPETVISYLVAFADGLAVHGLFDADLLASIADDIGAVGALLSVVAPEEMTAGV